MQLTQCLLPINTLNGVLSPSTNVLGSVSIFWALQHDLYRSSVRLRWTRRQQKTEVTVLKPPIHSKHPGRLMTGTITSTGRLNARGLMRTLCSV